MTQQSASISNEMDKLAIETEIPHKRTLKAIQWSQKRSKARKWFKHNLPTSPRSQKRSKVPITIIFSIFDRQATRKCTETVSLILMNMLKRAETLNKTKKQKANDINECNENCFYNKYMYIFIHTYI